MFDYYGFPSDAPGMADRPVSTTPQQKALHVQDAFARDIARPHFVPFLAVHEIEAWLFCELESSSWAFPEGSRLSELRAIRAKVGSPEEINDGFHTAPSRRILAACPAYQKATTGPVVLEAIGIDAIRRECPHFHGWLAQLEAACG